MNQLLRAMLDTGSMACTISENIERKLTDAGSLDCDVKPNARFIVVRLDGDGHIATPWQHPSPWWNAHPSPSEPFGELDGHRRAPLDFCNFFGYERIATDTPLAVIGPLTKSFPNDIISGISHFLFHSLSVPILL